jgi:hypothetical protein
MVRLQTYVKGLRSMNLLTIALLVMVSCAVLSTTTTHATLTNRSPNVLDVSSNGVPGAVSHLLKKEDVVTVDTLYLSAYYPESAGSGKSGKSLKIRYGEDGKKCNIDNFGSPAHFSKPNAMVVVTIKGADTVKYQIPISKVCDNIGSSPRNNKAQPSGDDWKNNKFFADYDFPKLNMDSDTGMYKAEITIQYTDEVNTGPWGKANNVNFITLITGHKDAKVGPVGADAGGNARAFGLRSAFVGDSQDRDIKVSTQFGVPCSVGTTNFVVKLFDPDTHIFADTFMWVTADGKKISLDAKAPDTRYGTVNKADKNEPGNNWKSSGGSNTSTTIQIKDAKPGVTYRLHISNPVQKGKQNNPNQNVLSVGLPYDSIYGDIDCDPDISGPEFTPTSITPSLVNPNSRYNVVTKITGGTVPKKPSESSFRSVPYKFHKIQYKPGVNPYGTGAMLTSRAFDDLDCGYFNGAGSNAGNTLCTPNQVRSDGTMDMSGDQAQKVSRKSVTEDFPNDAFSQEPGSTVCYAVSVKRPSEVYEHNYTQHHEHDTGLKDKFGNPIYDEEDHDRTDYYYREDGHNHKNSGWNPYTGGVNKAPEKREWATAISCVMVGSRPKVQILSNDLRVRQSDVVANVNQYESGLNYGSWIEYGTFVFGRDANVASGAGLRNGSPSGVEGRSEWSKLTFANLDTYGDYTTLGSQLQPGIVTYVTDELSEVPTVAGFSSGQLKTLPGNRYQSSGATTFGGDNTGISKTKIIYVNGTARITSNITLNNGPYANPGAIPQIIIVANNIDISDSVNRIDAWLITYKTADDGDSSTPNGNIDTCYNGPDYDKRNAKVCNKQLEVNGAVMSSTLELNRTGPEVFSPGAAAEVFRGRLDMYVWAYENQRKSSGNVAQTVDVVEAPARF